MCTPDKYIHDKIGFREQKQMTAEKRKEGERKKERKKGEAVLMGCSLQPRHSDLHY